LAEEANIKRIGRYEVKITRPQKVLFSEDDITKTELIDYYERIAPRMLPHLKDRALAMERYPDGIDNPAIFQKTAGFYFPDWIKKVRVKKVGGTVNHVVCDNAATLVYLANQACITPHIWLSRIDKLEYPDQMVYDLDPSEDDFALVKSATIALKCILDELRLPAYLKTTGSRGLHVAIPLKRQESFDSARAFARKVAEIVVNENPGERTLEQRKNMRRGRVFMDTNRNAYAQTVAPAYAVRARSGAPVSVPLDWDELKNTTRPDAFTIRNVFDRLNRIEDPWKDFGRRGTSLTAAWKKMNELTGEDSEKKRSVNVRRR
jgi:bifunctional non-homologous end joining protein LigD